MSCRAWMPPRTRTTTHAIALDLPLPPHRRPSARPAGSPPRSAPSARAAAAPRAAGREVLLRREDRGPDRAADDLEPLGVLGRDLELREVDERLERGAGVVDGRLGVALGEPPGVGDPGEPEDRLRDVADREPDALRRRLERDHDGAGATLDQERDGVGAAAAAFPAAAPAVDLDHLELRAVDRPADRRADLLALRAPESHEAVPVADDDGDGELEPATGVGHPLDHVHVQDLVVEPGEERVDDLRLP